MGVERSVCVGYMDQPAMRISQRCGAWSAAGFGLLAFSAALLILPTVLEREHPDTKAVDVNTVIHIKTDKTVALCTFLEDAVRISLCMN